ncbi:hypothetical protein KIN20_034827 [Parelaphostrongylus tenuis]|uniref:Protein kinase domain-containing protein n=1 Tax=Parelaphostrongylus tenuis TaxID=148309 RepID=A0AAD5RA95_PARTN|nr:hypothetical protein KIN20_034827 [Parelaphostrongylus tenuis]
MSNGEAKSTAYIPYQMLYKIIWEICNGMISGFGFCSDIGDTKFFENSVALRYLPVRWLAPECFHGKFSRGSDTWSFGVLLYEVFTLGDAPYDDLQKAEEIRECVLHSRIPAHPRYASRQLYILLQQCFHRYPERRPPFTQLKANFRNEMKALFVDMAYE